MGIDKQKRKYAQRLFQCLSVSIRPLCIDELAEILAIEFDGTAPPSFKEVLRPSDAQEAVFSACSSLIAVVNREGGQIVQFSHYAYFLDPYVSNPHGFTPRFGRSSALPTFRSPGEQQYCRATKSRQGRSSLKQLFAKATRKSQVCRGYQEQTRVFAEFRREDRQSDECVTCVVHVLHALYISTILHGSISLVRICACRYLSFQILLL